MKKYLLATMLLAQVVGLLFLTAGESRAQGPLSTPTQEYYNRTDLLTKIAPKSFTIQPWPVALNTGQGIEDTIAEGGSWFLTFNNLFIVTGAAGHLAFWIIVFFVAFLLTTWIIKRTGNSRTALKESGLGRGYKQYRQTRSDFRRFRGR